jgi:hypothetical protein
VGGLGTENHYNINIFYSFLQGPPLTIPLHLEVSFQCRILGARFFIAVNKSADRKAGITQCSMSVIPKVSTSCIVSALLLFEASMTQGTMTKIIPMISTMVKVSALLLFVASSAQGTLTNMMPKVSTMVKVSALLLFVPTYGSCQR